MSAVRRPGRQVVPALALNGLVVSLVTVPGAAASGEASSGRAPGAPGNASTWVPGDKTGFGTATSRASKVWYTLSRASSTRCTTRASTSRASGRASSS